MTATKDQVVTTEDAGMDDVVALAVESVNTEEAGAVKEESAETAPVENVVEASGQGAEEDVYSPSDGTPIEKEKEVSGKAEEEIKDDGLSDIIAKSKPKGEVEGAKDGTPDWLQKKIDKQTRQNKEAIEAKDEEIAALKANAIPVKRPPVPLQEDFVTTEEYQVAFQKHLDDDADWKTLNNARTQQEETYKGKLNQNIQKFKDDSTRMGETYEDFDRIVNQDTFYGHLSDFILATDFPTEISYHLGLPKNAETLKSLLKMDHVSAAIAIGEMSGRCKASNTKTLSTAPKVLKTVKDSDGGGPDEVGFSTSDIEKMSRSYLRTA